MNYPDLIDVLVFENEKTGEIRIKSSLEIDLDNNINGPNQYNEIIKERLKMPLYFYISLTSGNPEEPIIFDNYRMLERQFTFANLEKINCD